MGNYIEPKLGNTKIQIENGIWEPKAGNLGNQILEFGTNMGTQTVKKGHLIQYFQNSGTQIRKTGTTTY